MSHKAVYVTLQIIALPFTRNVLIGEGRGHLVDLPVSREAVKKGAGREARPVLL